MQGEAGGPIWRTTEVHRSPRFKVAAGHSVERRDDWHLEQKGEVHLCYRPRSVVVSEGGENSIVWSAGSPIPPPPQETEIRIFLSRKRKA